MRDDFKAAVRSLRSSPGFTAVALIVLALGIGATTAIFSVVDAVVLRGLPFEEHDRLVAVGERRPPGAIPDPARDPASLSSIAPQNYLDWAAQQQVFESMAAIAGISVTLREPGAEPEDLRAQRVTADFFTVLRVQPRVGRAFVRANEEDGRDKVVVLSDRLWRRRWGADPSIIGRTIPLEGASYEVIGIMPPEFEYPVASPRPTDLWVPYVVPVDERTRVPRNFNIYLSSIARLKPGVTVQQADAQMDQIAKALQAAHPEWNKNMLAGVRPLRDHIVGARTRSWMLMLLGAVGIVLLIACANVANLLLARATAREREIGIRAALGAGRGRLVRQLMVESLVLSAAGTALAVLLAWWGVSILRTSMPEGVPRVAQIAVDLRVLGAAAALAVVTGLLFGTFPALQLSKPDLTNALKDGARGASTGSGRQRLRAVLVIAEVALAVVLLVGAALFIGSFITLMRIDPGFDPTHVLAARVFPRPPASGPAPDNSRALQDIVDRVARIPGVVHASLISGGMPLGGAMSSTNMTVAGRTVDDPEGVSIRRVTHEYHRVMRIPLRGGRLFEPGDRQGTPEVVIINETAARRYFPGEDPLGRQVRINDRDWTVVGIVGDVHQVSLETEPMSEVYVPIGQARTVWGELMIRTEGDPYAVLPHVKAASLAVLPDVPLRTITSLEELVGRRVAQRKLNMLLLGLFGLLGLVISAVGIYGVMAYVIAQRTREIGVRMALGATRGRVVGMVIRSAAMMVFLGLAIGSACAWVLREAASGFLFRLDTTDPRAYIAALVSLAIAAGIASFVPARRAASVDPMEALRAE